MLQTGRGVCVDAGNEEVREKTHVPKILLRTQALSTSRRLMMIADLTIHYE